MLVVAALLACQIFCQVPFVSGDPSRLYITAEEVFWNYLTAGISACSEDPTAVKGSDLYTSKGIGSSYVKAQYVQYTDRTFTVRQNRTLDEEHLGLLGPRLFQLPGDVLEVVFQNRLPFPANIVPSGAFTNSTSAAEPGQTLVYNWTVGSEAAPADDAQGSSRLWLYRSTVDMEGHANAGLLGPLIVTRPSSALPNKQPSDVDQTLIVTFQVMDENSSPLLNATLARHGLNGTAGLSPADFVASNRKHTVGSRIFCNTQGLNIRLGSRVRWHVVAEGNEVDMHNTHWHGNTLMWEGHNADQLSLLAGSVKTGDMVVDNPGQWLFHCHVNDHITAGMKATYNVSLSPTQLGNPPGFNSSGGAVRQYYIAAEKVLWDFAPLGGNACSGTVRPFNAYGAAHAVRNASLHQIGSKRWRAHYVEYTDATFTQRKVHGPEEAYLGDLGPVLRATVGDTILFHFQNRLEYPVSVHAHGVFYNKSSEGALYADGTSGADKADDSVMPNATYTYVWEVRERSGPGPADPSSLVWMYHSHHAEVQDSISGLYGGIIVSRKELARPDGSPTDVDREFVAMYWVAHERMTFYAEENIEEFLPGTTLPGNAIDPSNTTAAAVAALRDTLTDEADPSSEADHFYGINGMVYCNLPKLRARQGERVRFHIFTLGTQDDLHAPSLVAAAFLDDGLRKETLQFMPGAMRSADAVLDAPGDFVLGCRTTLHVDNGMAALISVAPNATSAPDAGHGRGKVHYIRAELVQWDYAPGGLVDQCTGQPLDAETAIYADPDGPGLSGNLSKAVYRAYTDASFGTPLPHPPQHGILGPILHAQTGDYITVVFQNALPFPANMAPGGGLHQVAPAKGGGHMVAPKQTLTYTWRVPAHSGPGPGDFSAVAYTYRSTADITAHENAGLFGAIVIERPDGDADAYVEVPLLFSIQDEGLSALRPANLAAKAAQGLALNTTTDDFVEASRKHSVNGYTFCNMPEVRVRQGARLRLLLIGIGSETGMHTPGFTDLVQHTPSGASYVVELYPGMAKVVGMYADAPGRWEFRCNVQHHFNAGMKGVLAISPTDHPLDSLALPSY